MGDITLKFQVRLISERTFDICCQAITFMSFHYYFYVTESLSFTKVKSWTQYYNWTSNLIVIEIE